jgi:hypothetical protein
LVVGLFLLVAAILGATATVHAGQHDCGSAISAHTPEGRFTAPGSRARAEDQCDAKITGRRRLVAPWSGSAWCCGRGRRYRRSEGLGRRPPSRRRRDRAGPDLSRRWFTLRSATSSLADDAIKPVRARERRPESC